MFAHTLACFFNNSIMFVYKRTLYNVNIFPEMKEFTKSFSEHSEVSVLKMQTKFLCTWFFIPAYVSYIPNILFAGMTARVSKLKFPTFRSLRKCERIWRAMKQTTSFMRTSATNQTNSENRNGSCFEAKHIYSTNFFSSGWKNLKACQQRLFQFDYRKILRI